MPKEIAAAMQKGMQVAADRVIDAIAEYNGGGAVESPVAVGTPAVVGTTPKMSSVNVMRGKK
jgi:hypothetical protein